MLRDVEPKPEDSQESKSGLRSDASLGLGRLLSGAPASTNGDLVGAPLAAFTVLGNKLFEMSHQTASLPLLQVSAYLKGQPIDVKIHHSGLVFSTVLDYVYRNTVCEEMNLWTFVSTMKAVRLMQPNSADHLLPSNLKFRL